MYRRGRPVSINKQRLECISGKDYAELLFFGDLHLGYPTCLLEEKAKPMLDYCLKRGVYVIGMGDYIECGTTISVGDSVYHQTLNPQDQLEECTELFRPLADAGLLLGLLFGNHEARILNMTSIDVVRIMCGSLNVPYLFNARMNYLTVGNQNYKVYTQHGKTGSRFAHTKLKAATDAVSYIRCDVGAYGHVHDLIFNIVEEQDVDARSRKLIFKKKLILVTGHYLGWNNSYAQGAGYSIGKVGSPKIRLSGVEKDFHVSG